MLAETRDRYVYQIRASDDGRVVYIGMGKWKRCHCKHRKNLDINALIDAGGTLPVEIVAGPLSQADAWALEIELIAKHRRPVDGGTLLNRSTGGFGGGLGVNPSPETRARLRASNRSSSPEIRAKIAAALKGRPLPSRPTVRSTGTFVPIELRRRPTVMRLTPTSAAIARLLFLGLSSSANFASLLGLMYLYSTPQSQPLPALAA
jgi:hypothetical protein